MELLINLRHLEDESRHLTGSCTPKELDLQSDDDVITLLGPLQYDVEAQLMEEALLVQGRLELPLECTCVRCLKRFQESLVLDDWVCHVPLQGDEKALVINDCVDLTPYVREDIFLAFPQHPLCDADCRGLPEPPKKAEPGSEKTESGTGEASPWSVLDKLKL